MQAVRAALHALELQAKILGEIRAAKVNVDVTGPDASCEDLAFVITFSSSHDWKPLTLCHWYRRIVRLPMLSIGTHARAPGDLAPCTGRG